MNNNKTKSLRSKSARELALDLMIKIEQEGAYSNLLLNKTLEKHQLVREEASLLTELVYGSIQRKNTLDYFLNKWLKKGTDKLELWVLQLLRLSLYQLLYLQKIPDHAVVDEAVKLAKRKGHRGISGMVNGVLRNILRNRGELVIPNQLSPAERISIEQSHPKWLVSRWIHTFGTEVTAQICEANNQPPAFSIRVNRLKTDRNKLLNSLQNEGFNARPSQIAPEGILVERAGNLAHSEWFNHGEMSIQDQSSMLPVELLGPRPGMRVLDACAAPGGKTAQIAELMDDRGEVWANDFHPHKEKLIASQAERLNLSMIRTCVGDARKLSERFQVESFDAVLVDAPCSGFGVIRRKPDLKWVKDEKQVSEIASIQQEILQSVSKLVKPGGVMVYSTCTLEKLENEDNVTQFLQSNSDWSLDPHLPERLPEHVREHCRISPGMLQILPHQFSSDGFFMARLKKS